jgi:hypothetical protein
MFHWNSIGSVSIGTQLGRCVEEPSYVPLIGLLREGCPEMGYPTWQRCAHSLSRLRGGGPETASGKP